MSRILYLLLLCCAGLFCSSSCVENKVRMYVEVSDSCSSYCEGLTFHVNYDSKVERTLGAGQQVLIERSIGDNGKLFVTVHNDTDADNHPLRCQKYVNSNINIQGWTPTPEDDVYVYYNQLIYFQNKDIHVKITCAPLPDITPGACDDVSCWEPQENVCVENTVIELVQPQGVCSEGECKYPSVLDLCVRGWCFDTKCGSAQPCEDVYCINPPPNECTASGGLKTYEPFGVCEEDTGKCQYDAVETACPSNQCSNGACVAVPCKGVYCNKPPANHCVDRNTLKSFSPTGRCVDSGDHLQCAYMEKLTPCKYGCADGNCIVDSCTDVVCSSPPASYCDWNDLIVYEDVGFCSKGACRYISKPRMVCSGGCREGKCQDNLCRGKTCNDPPSPYCSNDTTLAVYGAEGTCADGVCTYTPSPKPCEGACKNGACTGKPCLGVLCNRPPSDYCIDDVTAMQFSAAGTCTGNGTCDYGGEAVPCPLGCFEGWCPE